VSIVKLSEFSKGSQRMAFAVTHWIDEIYTTKLIVTGVVYNTTINSNKLNAMCTHNDYCETITTHFGYDLQTEE
jgi:hypothetical protein